jgi:hypothetical protein
MLDSNTGATVALSIIPPVYYSDGWGWEAYWTASPDLVYKQMIAEGHNFYIALEASTLQLVSMGVFRPEHDGDYVIVGADASGSSIVNVDYDVNQGSGARLVGARMPAFNGTQG